MIQRIHGLVTLVKINSLNIRHVNINICFLTCIMIVVVTIYISYLVSFTNVTWKPSHLWSMLVLALSVKFLSVFTVLPRKKVVFVLDIQKRLICFGGILGEVHLSHQTFRNIWFPSLSYFTITSNRLYKRFVKKKSSNFEEYVRKMTIYLLEIILKVEAESISI